MGHLSPGPSVSSSIVERNSHVGDLRLDFLIDNKVVVELKAVERILPIHKAQVLTYLKLTGCKLGLLINFNVPVLKDGVERIVLGL